MVALRLCAPLAVILGPPWTWIGWALAALGLALSFSGAGLFRRVGTNIKTFDDPNVLVTGGPFRLTRNPMYLGFVLLLAGVALALGAASPWVVPAAFWLLADRWYIPFEERAMRRTFGEPYEAYSRRVRRWL
eukprot:gene19292-19175_t